MGRIAIRFGGGDSVKEKRKVMDSKLGWGNSNHNLGCRWPQNKVYVTGVILAQVISKINNQPPSVWSVVISNAFHDLTSWILIWGLPVNFFLPLSKGTIQSTIPSSLVNSVLKTSSQVVIFVQLCSSFYSYFSTPLDWGFLLSWGSFAEFGQGKRLLSGAFVLAFLLQEVPVFKFPLLSLVRSLELVREMSWFSGFKKPCPGNYCTSGKIRDSLTWLPIYFEKICLFRFFPIFSQIIFIWFLIK